MTRKGIVLAGGAGTRLYPATLATSKQLLPVYDKPMVYYPLSTLMLAGLREILLIATPQDLPRFQQLLGDGAQWGISLHYAAQASPDGIAQAYTIACSFLAGAPSALILGDNLFYGQDWSAQLRNATAADSATVFAYPVKDPERYGVIEFGPHQQVLGIEEKPVHPRSRYALTGLYFLDGRACDVAEHLRPSPRGELEITDLIRQYLAWQCLTVSLLGRGMAWLDTGTHDTLLEASQYIATLERRQGLKVACLEEIAWRQGWIDDAQLDSLAARLPGNYGQYLRDLLAGNIL